jgi:hypothetical protein
MDVAVEGVHDNERPSDQLRVGRTVFEGVERHEQVSFGHSRHPRVLSDLRPPPVSE